MLKAIKIILLFQKPDWNDYRFPYIFFGILAWLEIISLLITTLK